jgi:hypothetical protein
MGGKVRGDGYTSKSGSVRPVCMLYTDVRMQKILCIRIQKISCIQMLVARCTYTEDI